MGDIKFESKDKSQMRAVGKVDGTAYLGDHNEFNAPQEVIVSGVGDQPPNYRDYWVDRVAVQTTLEQHLDQYPVTTIVADGGFGKSSLAAWAHDRLQGRFDKRVWIEFRQVKSFDRVARWILQEMGFPVKDPQATEETLRRELLYRLDEPNRPVKVLVVLDRLETMGAAADWRWFADFLAEWADRGRGSRVLVTTRSTVGLPGAIDLGGLSIGEGQLFLEREGVSGAGLARLVELAEGHPLLLKLAAAWVRQTYGARVDERAIDFFEKLFGQYEGDLTAKVEDIFETLFLALSDQLRELLLKVSVYRLPIDLGMAQAMRSETTIEDLEMLAGKGLLLQQADCFVLHPLVEAFIRSRVSEGDRAVAHESAIGFYAANYQQWDGTIESCREELEVFYHACELGQYGQAKAALDRCLELLERRGYYRELLPLYQRLVGEWVPEDAAAQQDWGWAMTSLGNLQRDLGQYEEAIASHEDAGKVFEELDFAEGKAASLGNLGNAYRSLGQYQRAIDFLQQHNEIAREIGDRGGEATSLGNLGNAYKSLGQYQRAIDFLQQHNEITREIGDRGGEAISLGNLGNAYQSLGQYQRAIDFYLQDNEIAREIGDRWGEGASLFNMGNALQSLNRYSEALQKFHQAQSIYTELKLNHIIEKCNAAIQTCERTIAKKQNTQRGLRFLFCFSIGLAICLLIWWVRT